MAIMFLGGMMCGAILLMHPRCRAFVSRVVHKIERMLTADSAADSAPKTTNYDDARYASMFNDKNNLHLSVARKVGLRKPLKTRVEADKVKSGLVKIKSCDNYSVDRLTHSIPYLTPGAADLLDVIGREFLAALKSKDRLSTLYDANGANRAGQGSVRGEHGHRHICHYRHGN